MDVTLPPKLEELVRKKVASGLYDDASEVIRDALRLMAAQDEAYQARLDRLRTALEAGERSGFAEDFSMDRLQAELDKEARP